MAKSPKTIEMVEEDYHTEIERIDPLEIIDVEHVLSAGARRGVLSEVGFEQCQDWS